jgi:precorrin-2 dehydrogenase/sirohydrochlorin ferrochelatase
MIPVFIDPSAVRITLIGRGAAAVRRLQWLRQAGATPDVWSDAPSAEPAADLHMRLPGAADIAAYQAIWIAGLSMDEARPLAEAARARGALVNVEDVVELCDFHTPAVVRRGKLMLAAGTGGASPAAARAARERLEEAFPEDWAEALDEIAASRSALRADGAGFEALVADARWRLARRGLI